jgi:hypothetical protein
MRSAIFSNKMAPLKIIRTEFSQLKNNWEVKKLAIKLNILFMENIIYNLQINENN